MTNQELILNFESLVKEERRITKEVLQYISLIESRKVYLELGYDGIYSYLTKGLGYSEGAAYRRLQSARVLNTVPAASEKIESGSLNLMQLTEVAKLSRKSKKAVTAELIQKLESKSKADTEQILAEEFNMKPEVHTKSRVQKDRSVRLEITFTEEQFAELKQARSLLSHICHEGSWPEVITELARQYSRKLERREKKKVGTTPSRIQLDVSERNDVHPGNTTSKIIFKSLRRRVSSPVTKHCNKPITKPPREKPSPHSKNQHRIKTHRPYLSLSIKRQIFSRASGQCEHVDTSTGRRCSSTYQPQIDHIVPFSKGGTDEIHNLQLLCGVHNRAKGSTSSEF